MIQMADEIAIPFGLTVDFQTVKVLAPYFHCYRIILIDAAGPHCHAA